MSGKEHIGFIGVGLMGHGMAKNMLEAGHALTILGHRNRAPVDDLVSRGASEAKSPAEMASMVDILFLCVTSSVQVEDLMRREDGILAGARAGLIVIDSSTSDPNSTLALVGEAKAKGVTMIDAPLGNTPKEAELGKLNAFVGADEATFARVRPIIATWAENITHVGAVGTGHKAKLINNFVALAYNAIYAEAFTACRKSGVDDKKFHEIISAGGLNSGLFQRMCNWIIGGDPEAHLFTLKNGYKDIKYYTQLADAAEMAAPVGNATKQCYALAVANGHGERHLPMLTDVINEVNGIAGGKG